MRFTWNPQKSARNQRERGFDFAFATLIFEGSTLAREDHRQDYGERRMVAIGLADGVALTVVFTDRVDAHDHLERRIISARRSNRHERQAYQKALRST
ncbi:MAG TPA: BrnT family toxin [Gemmatimonadales bacterium]|nr:BrnT family toxin [Gemmatimonadales bacterium]